MQKQNYATPPTTPAKIVQAPAPSKTPTQATAPAIDNSASRLKLTQTPNSYTGESRKRSSSSIARSPPVPNKVTFENTNAAKDKTV